MNTNSATRPDLSRTWLVAAIVFWLANALLHQEISNWIVASYDTPWGAIVPRDYSLTIALFCSLVFVVYLALRLRFNSNAGLDIAAWLLLSALAIVIWQLLTTVDVELIHYPQYALIAWFLARAFDPYRRQWPLLSLASLTLLLGILDELFQYFYLTPANNSYVDFNDFILNLVGACAGLLAYYSLKPGARQKQSEANGLLRRATATLWAASGMLVLLLLVLGRLQYSPAEPVAPGGISWINDRWVIVLQHEAGLLSSWLNGFSRDNYYVTGFPECLLISLGLLASLQLYRWLHWRSA